MDHWQDRAACAGVPVDVFFPLGVLASAEPALRLCSRCEVTRQCAELGLRCSHGIFASVNREDRDAVPQLRAKAGYPPPEPREPREKYVQRISTKELRYCRICQRAMRAPGVAPDEAPGTVQERAKRLCAPCYRDNYAIRRGA